MRTIKEQLGARVKEIRKTKGVSQEKLSEKVGIDAKHLSRIEVGGSFPSLDTLAKLAGALHVELKDFFEFAHEAENPKELKEVLNDLMKEATPDKLKIAVKVLRAIVR
ncbi:MAG: helix-turn-helix transcriptional regulator [Nitrospirae bacterium]|nr:helix-turn-helix transcriptional regulator [Nitrospirota bacterium]